MTSIHSLLRSTAAGTLLLAFTLTLPGAGALADSGTNAAQDNLAQVFNPTLRPGATSQRQGATAPGATQNTAQVIFNRYWGFEQSDLPPRGRAAFGAVESVAQDNIDKLFKQQ